MQAQLFNLATPTMEHLDIGRIRMREISHETAKTFIVTNHYSHTFPCCEIALGFYIDDVLNCVIVYGQSATARMADSLPSEHYLELTRLFSFDWAGRNIESYCIGQSLKFIRQNRPDIKCLVSFADPSENHSGTIYQATNWLYCGLSDQTGGYIYLIDGKWQHPRSTVAELGTREHDEVLRLHPGIEFKRIPRKHRYIYLLGSKKERKCMRARLKYPILPYPKRGT